MTDVVAPPDVAPTPELAPARVPSRAARVGVLCLILTAVIGIGTPLVGDRVFIGTDLLKVYAPWHTYDNVTAEQHLVFSDTVDFYTPQRIDAAKLLRSGELPWWNPYPAGGTPLASIPDTAVFSPLNLPWLLLPGWLAPAYNTLVGLGVAALGMFLFLRRLALSKPAAIIGGAAYMTTGFMSSWTGWPHEHVAALVPMLFWSIERAIQRASWRSTIPIALVLATMWAEGFPAVTGFAIYAAAAYTLIRLLSTMPLDTWRGNVREVVKKPLVKAKARLGGIVAAGVALGTALLGFQLLPFVAHLSVVDIESRNQRPSLHLPLNTIMTVVFPYAFGNPVSGSTGKGTFFYHSNNLIEINAYVGAAMIVGIVALIAWRRPRRVPAGACTALSLIAVVTAIALYEGGTLLGLLQKFPVFSNNPIGRARSILDFALPALGAIGIDRVISDRDDARRVDRRRVAIVWILTAIGTIFLISRLVSDASAAHRVGWVLTHAIPGIVAAVVTAAVLWLAVVAARNVRLVCVAVPIVVMVDALAFVGAWWPTSARADFYPQTPTHTYLEQHLGHQRYAAEGGTMLQSSNTYYGLRAVTAHAFRQPSWYELVSAIEPAVKQAPTQLFLGEDMKSLASPVLDRLSAQYFVADPLRPIPGTTIAAAPVGHAGVLQAGHALSGTPVPGGSAMRAVLVQLIAPLAPTKARQRVHIDLMAGSRVVATAWRDLNGGWPAGYLALAVPEVDSGVTGVRVSFEGPGHLSLGVSGSGQLVLGRIDDPDDGARLVQSEGATVYDRTRALPRVRWMPRSTVIASKTARLDALVRGSVGLDTVVLSDGHGVTPGSGLPARSFKVVTDDPGHIRVDVDAAGAGFVEVADAIQHAWTATVDGHSSRLLDADHALVAVSVPEGHHVIDVTYHATGQRKGFVLSFLAVLVLIGIGAGPFIRRQIEVRRAAAIPSDSGTD